MQVTMASKLLLSVFLLACLGVCHGRHHKKHPQGDHPSTYSASNGGDLEPSCTGECPECELLCWTPEYDVRRCKSALWVSTTMSDLSLSQASGRGRKRLHDYFGGANDKRLKMSYTVPMVTQTRAPSESPVREITVSMLLPKEVAKNPPKPADPMVVIDLVAETILYVKKFGGRSPRVGFVADLEAKNFFKTLRNNKEPSYEEDNYYYVAQYGSSDSFNHNMYNEIWIYAMNERTYKWLEFNDLTADGQGLPKCLRGDEEPIVWEKMDQSDIPMLTREQCSTTYCQAPKKCPKIETSGVEGVDDKSIKLKQYKDIRALGYVPPTCYYDTAVHASAGPLLKSLDNAGVPAPDVAGTLTVAIEKREELDGVNSCQKLFKVWYVAGGGTGSPEDLTLLKTENGFQTPRTVEALHARQYTTVYTKCFGGNAYYEPSTITSTAKKLMERLRDKKKCFLGDHVGVAEYHPQSRLFDRYNEIDLDADLDCSDQEGRPPFTFHLPVSKDYSRTEARPSLGDRCDTHECPKMTTIMGLENNLKIVEYAPASWFYSKSPSKSCSNMEAFYKALNPLLSYLNGKNEDNSKIDMTKPLYGKVNMFEQRCEKVTTLSTMVPEKFADNPPKPIDDTVSFDHPAVESRFFRSLYKGRYSSGELERRLHDLINDLDNLKPFGVQYNIQDIWLGTFDDPGKDERLFEYIIELIKVPKEGQDDITSEEAGEDQNEDTSDGKVALPKPEGCSESICPTVYVTKNHSNFLEVLLPKRRSACHRAKLCGDPYPFGRQLTRPLVKYFHGDNSDNKTINNFAVPLYKARVYSAEESEKGIGQCEREYEVCLRLPQEYEGKELPKPTGEGVATFTTTEGFHVYATPVKGPFIVSEETQKLMQTLDEGSVQYDKTWVGFFTYKEPFDDPQERITYFVFLKQGEELDGEGEPNELEIEKKEGDMKTQPEKTEG